MPHKDWRGGPDWGIFVRDSFRCVYCNLDMMPLNQLYYRWDLFIADHLNPKCKDGRNAKMNLVTACMGCKRLKSGFDPTDNGNDPLCEESRERLIQRAKAHIEAERKKWNADAEAMLKEAGRL
jgi:hypothetical protein